MASVTKTLSECSIDYCRICIERIECTSILNAFVTLLKEEALTEAAESNERKKNGTNIFSNTIILSTLLLDTR